MTENRPILCEVARNRSNVVARQAQDDQVASVVGHLSGVALSASIGIET